ncbi:hypothetical protein RYA05_07540 [Pseudomonas syringae pv. actinidiae]|uniref:Pyruvate-formate lyase-activating enzyme n=2 Tax=Pseudomonas syringae group TaxID=136849 RepID=A0A0K8M5J1_PSESF|nr:hypothetical protein [Pseudomonas syringae]EPN65800.1 hypothetical protein A234_33429 [Pseudomonas syringae pv. actinidiae ICMP 19101]EPN72961.1 hypothetical protein A235_01444 [Pseudomonas syringae pv. actinidiae ICMP 19079]OZI84411.1 hypothetical protein CFN58_24945 [Pseudomonas avellanae]AKT29325.1 hypothetical protein IYO_007310 [Pseudomonas syringae pv. actinidiae ICMP 18884]AOE55816.1 hypothetical protein NZ708_07300 [Pseudomonas syringae pv. actinidiae ICMP 18708]
MSDGKKERSFLATLDLKDGTKLGFSKIAAGGYHPEGVEELCANSLLKQSIKIRFEPNDEGYYVMLFKGFAPADKVPSKTDGPWGYATQGIVHVANKEHIPESQSDVASNTSPIYLAVGASGWVHKTKESGHAYLAQLSDCGGSKFSIDRTDAQDVYLKSWRSQNNMQTYKREDFPTKAWFAWMTDCDGTDAVLKLTIIERYNADGSVRT